MKEDTYYEINIEAGKTELNYWKDIWSFRELFYILVWRDIKVRYKQTLLGIAWSVLRPFFTMVVFTIVFSRIANLPTEADAPYPILVFAALLPWQFFANAVNESSNSLLTNQNLVTKVYFPKIIIPISAVSTSLIDMLISIFILMGLMIFYAYPMSWKFIFIPVFMILVFLLSVGMSLLLSSFNIKYRDFRYIIPFFIQAGLFISPVGFSSNIVPEEWQMIYNLNPMVGIIEGFRWSIIRGDTEFGLSSFYTSIIISLIFLIIGTIYFRKMERKLADLI